MAWAELDDVANRPNLARLCWRTSSVQFAQARKPAIDSRQPTAMTSTQEPFDSWVSPHLPVLLALAIREVGADAAQDVVQEALLRAWRRRQTFDTSRSLRAWLIAILLDQAKRYRVRRLRPWVVSAESAAGPLGIDDRLTVQFAVQSLPRRQRQVITLYYLADLPVAEIAKVLGITESSVKSSLYDGRKALQTLLRTT